MRGVDDCAHVSISTGRLFPNAAPAVTAEQYAVPRQVVNGCPTAPSVVDLMLTTIQVLCEAS